MEKESGKKNRVKRQRQDWNPHWSLKILYAVWMTVLAGLKIALGAVATVLMIVLVCGFVFVGILGEYLEKDVLPESANYEFNVSDLEQTSNMYYEIAMTTSSFCRNCTPSMTANGWNMRISPNT